MKTDQNQKSGQLIKPKSDLKSDIEEAAISLEELESLCYTFNSRPKGCNSFSATGENDDVLF